MNLYQDVFFRSLDLLRGRHNIERLHFLRKSQYWPLERIREWQLERLNELLLQAREHSPFHGERLAGIRLPLRDLSEVQQLPVLTKDDIRAHQQEIRCTNIPEHRFVESRTGGSTGQPMFYYWDRQGQDWNRASVYRAAEWGGTALGERTVQMSGSHFDYSQAQSLASRITLFLQRYRDLSVAFLTEDLLEVYYETIMKWRPTGIWGYASGLDAFARHILEHHPDRRPTFVRGLFTSSETLFPEQRARINEAFGGEKVFDQYGSRELYMASECEAHEGYHFHAEVIFGEVVDPDNQWCKPGEMGRILLTDLSNHAFPFIRYEIGDLGAMAEEEVCACGRALPRLARVEGRIADVIVLRDRILTPPNFATLFSDLRGIRAYQIRQERPDRLDVLLEPDEHWQPDFADYVRGAIEQMVEGQARVHIHTDRKIEVPESGKRRFIVSEVSREHL